MNSENQKTKVIDSELKKVIKKRKNIFLVTSFLNRYIVSKITFIFSLIISLLAFLSINWILFYFIQNGKSQNVAFISRSYILIIFSLTNTVFLISIISYFLFASIKQNGVSLTLLTSPVSRSQILLIKFTLIFFYNVIFLLLEFLALVLINFFLLDFNSLIFNLNLNLLFANLILVLLLTPIIIFVNYYFKAIVSVVLNTLLIVLIPGSFFTFRLVFGNQNSDQLSYNEKINQNNYALIYDVDENGNIQKEIIVAKIANNEQKTVNTSQELHGNLNLINENLNNFSLGEIFFQLPITFMSYDLNTLKSSEIYQLSSQNHSLNTILIDSVELGKPSEIHKVKNPVAIAFQDLNPFKMTYKQFLDNIYLKIEELKLNTSKGNLLMSNITSKTNDIDYWDLSYFNFDREETDILQNIAGLNNPEFFYFLKYSQLLENKYNNIYSAIKQKYNENISNFFKYLWKDSSFKENVISYKTILDFQIINNHFPNVGIVNRNNYATDSDISFFKNVLIHFDSNNQSKILQKGTMGYAEIDLSQLDNSIIDRESYEKYIDKNKEVVNLDNIYQNLRNLNDNLNSNYEFKANDKNIYAFDEVIKIEQKSFINNLWMNYLIIILLSSLLSFIIFIVDRKRGF